MFELALHIGAKGKICARKCRLGGMERRAAVRWRAAVIGGLEKPETPDGKTGMGKKEQGA